MKIYPLLQECISFVENRNGDDQEICSRLKSVKEGVEGRKTYSNEFLNHLLVDFLYFAEATHSDEQPLYLKINGFIGKVWNGSGFKFDYSL